MAKRRSRGSTTPAVEKPVAPTLSMADGWRDIRLTTDEAGNVGKMTGERIRQLTKANWIKRVGFNEYRLGDVIDGLLAYREDQVRQSTADSEQARLSKARRVEIEQRMARERGELVSIEAVAGAHAETISTFSAEMAGIGAASTRDLALRAEIQGHVNAAIDRCRVRLGGAEGDLRSNRDVTLDTEDTDAG